MLPQGGLTAALLWLALAAYPLYMIGVALLVVSTKWVVIGRYRPTTVSIRSAKFFRWWVVDRLHTFTNELVLAPVRGSPLYTFYLICLGLRATGTTRIDTKYLSEFDLVTLGRGCVIAEGAKVRPAVVEAGMLHLRPIVLGDNCAVGENAVCTAGAVAGDGVTLQPLSMFSGRTARTLPDGSVWKGAPLVQSRQQAIRIHLSVRKRDLFLAILAVIISVLMFVTCSAAAYAVFGLLASAQGFAYRIDPKENCVAWEWHDMPEGWLFAAVWLLYGPPVMASADVLLGYDMAAYADSVAGCLGDSRWIFGLRISGMIVVSFAAYGWALTLFSALAARVLRGPLRLARRVVLRMIFPRYPAQLSGTGAMALYMRLLGGKVSLSSTLAFAECPLEPRKMHVAQDAVMLGPVCTGYCFVRRGSLVGGGAVMLPHAEVEQHAIVGGNTVVGRPVGTGLVLASNPGVIARSSALSRPPPRPSLFALLCRSVLRWFFPVLAPMLLQAILLVTLLPAMYVLTVVLDTWSSEHHGVLGFVVLCAALAPVYVLLGVCLSLVAVLLKWLLVGRLKPSGRWRWLGSCHSYVFTFVQSVSGLSSAIFMGMAHGTPTYNFWLRSLGVRVKEGALILTPITEFDNITIGKEAVVDRDAAVSGQRMLPASGGPAEFATCFSGAHVGQRATVSVAANVIAAETGELSVLAPLSALGPSMKLPTRTMAIGSPPQKFVWSKERDNLVRPSARPLPKELSQEVFRPAYLRRAMTRMKVRSEPAVAEGNEQLAALVTGAGGFLGRYVVDALLEASEMRVYCLVRATDAEAAQRRVVASLEKAGVSPATTARRVTAVCGDLSKRHFGLGLSDFQNLAGKVTHVFNSAAKVNLAEPFDTMRKDNVDATAHVLELCCTGRPKQLHHISTMGVLTPDMLNRHGAVSESAPLGDVRTMPMYGTGDQANGYPFTKWCAERMVFEAGQSGLQVFVHRAGLIGGDSRTGALAEDVFFHFLSDVVKLHELPDMEGDKFNITPVDWVAKAIVRVATAPFYTRYAGCAVHPSAVNNTVTTLQLAEVLRAAGYRSLKWVDFWQWRAKIIADPEKYKSWSFCAALGVEGNGIDSMADNSIGFRAMKEAVGEEALKLDPRKSLQKMLCYCQARGMLPLPMDERGAARAASASQAGVPLLRGETG